MKTFGSSTGLDSTQGPAYTSPNNRHSRGRGHEGSCIRRRSTGGARARIRNGRRGRPVAAVRRLAFDPLSPAGRANYCVNTAIQFYSPTLQPLGHNIRLSAHTWDPQLNAPKRSCICGSSTFLGDYFGVDSGGGYTYATSISTFDYGQNPSYYQQQIVVRVATPKP
ncbi:MAG TPA: hypothetical protein VGJ25_04585 [Gaiellaceae bacterium]